MEGQQFLGTLERKMNGKIKMYIILNFNCVSFQVFGRNFSVNINFSKES